MLRDIATIQEVILWFCPLCGAVEMGGKWSGCVEAIEYTDGYEVLKRVQDFWPEQLEKWCCDFLR